jgi:polyisoprenoid-binding protein YceI
MGNKPILYAIDPKLSRFTVQAFAGGLLSGFGHNPTFAVRDFTGEAKFSPDSPQDGLLLMKISADSLQLTTDVNDKDRKEIERTMRQEVLETDKYPEICYEGSVVSVSEPGPGRYRVNLAGQLFLHGVSRDPQVVAELSAGPETLRAYGKFSVSQTAFGIRLVSVAGGAMKIKDELKCSFDIVARKSEPAKSEGDKVGEASCV